MANEDEGIIVEASWTYNPGSVPVSINQILVQEGPATMSGGRSGEFILTLGTLVPPPPSAFTDGERIHLPVATVGQYAITFSRLAEFSQVLAEYVESNRQTYGLS